MLYGRDGSNFGNKTIEQKVAEAEADGKESSKKKNKQKGRGVDT